MRPSLCLWLSWVIAAMWMAWLMRRLPRSERRWILRFPEDTSTGGGAVVGGEVIAAGEAGHVGDVADDGAGDDRADAEHLGEGGAGDLDRGSELLAGAAQLGI